MNLTTSVPNPPTQTKQAQSAPAPSCAEANGSAPLREAADAFTAKPTIVDRLERFFSRLSTKNNFWHRFCSFIWLPIAYRSGIQMRTKEDSQGEAFTAVLPFRRFNRNWYSAMAGAALLANSEVAGGMYVFKSAGNDYTVVCKDLHYKFLRPCLGPAVYRVIPKADLDALVAAGSEFNIDVVINIYQGLAKVGEKEKRVGRCYATFHVTPKTHIKGRKLRDKAEKA